MAQNELFEKLLETLMSQNNDARNAAEEQYSSTPFSVKLPMLIHSMRTSLKIENRQLAAILLRKLLVDNSDDYMTLDNSQQQFCKTELLAALQTEKESTVRRKLCDTVSELARLYVDDENQNQWPEILQFLFQYANSDVSCNKEIALLIFSNFSTIFGNQQTHYLEVIKRMLFQCLNDNNNLEIAYLAVKATTAFLMVNENDQLRKHFHDIIPSILRVVEVSLNNEDDESPLKNLIEIAESIPKLLRPHLNTLASELLKHISNAQASSSYRQLALEVLVSLSESAPAMMRKHGQIIVQLVPQCLAMMVDLEDDPQWSISDSTEDPEDTDSNAAVAEFALDRMAVALGGKTILPHIIAVVPQMLQNTDWRFKYAGLMAISAVGDGCRKQMLQLLTSVLATIVPFLKDGHPRVRYAACNAIGQMATDFAQHFQRKFHEKIIPPLLYLMDDIENPRVQAHASAALYHFCDECPNTILRLYLQPIAAKLKFLLQSKLQELMQKGTKCVLEQAIIAISTVSQTAEADFLPYYDDFMPSLKYIMQNAITPEYRLLRGKTIECISSIGLAVGPEKFLHDANDVMQLLLKTQSGVIDMVADDPQVSYMMTAWARICKILGQQFVQYLPIVMPPLMKAAATKAEIAILDDDDEKEEEEGWEFVKLGDQQKFGIRTAGLEDKSTACQMLVCYAKELKEGFADYVEEVAKILVPLIKFYLHEGVRSAAIESLPYLIESARFKVYADDSLLNRVWQDMLKELFQALKLEPEPDLLASVFESLAKCITSLGKGCLSYEQLQNVASIIHDQVDKLKKNAQQRQEVRRDEDYDEEVEENLQEEDEFDAQVLGKISDVLHALFKVYNQDFLPIFDHLVPDFVSLITPDRNWLERQWSLCVFDDLIEFTGNASFAYHQLFIVHFVNGIIDRHAEIRQSACYGCGIIAQFGGEEYAKFIPEMVPQLLKAITDVTAREPENISATENAVSAIVKICKYRSSFIEVNSILSVFLDWLPITEDEEEAPHVYAFFCELIESNNQIILGKDNGNLPKILSICALTLASDILVDCVDVKKRIETIINQVRSVPDMWNSCLHHIGESERQILLSLNQ